MEKPSVFNYSDYKDLLKSHAKSKDVPRGYLRTLAEAAGCQRSYFSSVLHTHNHLTPDQACALAEFWELTSAETDYFLALVDHARAGSPLLRKRMALKLQTLRKEHEDFGRRLDRPIVPVKSDELEMMYYSSWIYSALHILSSIHEFQRTATMARKLNLSEDQTRATLHLLKKMGLIEETSKDHWRHSSASRHISHNSPLVFLHHGNWRQQAVLNAQINRDTDLHFTTVTAMSESAYKQIKKIFLESVEKANAIAEPSESEVIVCILADLFQV